MKYFVFILLIFTSCNLFTNKKKQDIKNNDTITNNDTNKTSNLEDTIGVYMQMTKFYKTDSMQNPFISSIDTFGFWNCNQSLGKENVFFCVINQFQYCKAPLEFGEEIIHNKGNKFFCDSLFICDCLNDTEYFKTPYFGRCYSYIKGRRIKTNENYILIVIPLDFNLGVEYYLCSFSLKGDLISKVSIGGNFMGRYKIYGFMKNNLEFEIHRIDVAQNENLKKVDLKYRIDNRGYFIKE